MPRVATKTKSTRGAASSCVKCGRPITPGQKYHEWAFFRSAARRQHEECGYPRPSQLTQSKLSAVYGAIEDAEETISKADDPSDIVSALTSVAEQARETGEEYTESAEAMGSAGESSVSAERAEALESFANEVENAASEIEGEEFERKDAVEGAEEETEEEQKTAWLQNLREQANEALGNFSV